MIRPLIFTLSINVIAPEFPGYGIYPGYPKEEQLFEDSLSVYDYLVDELKIPKSNIEIINGFKSSIKTIQISTEKIQFCFVYIQIIKS